MPQQRSLFDSLPGFREPPPRSPHGEHDGGDEDSQAGGHGGPPVPAGKKVRRRALLDPETLPVPDKLGPPRLRFGTSSWTYPGWSGKVFRDVAAYGSTSRFTERCLAEYARDPRFRTAGADNMYYAPPAQRHGMLARFRQQLDGVADTGVFDLCPKVWHGITVNRYTQVQRDKWRMNTEINRDFLDPEVFVDQVAQPLIEGLGPHLGPLILEIQENDIHPAEFAAQLDRFLGVALSRAGCKICVELRTLDHFTPRYLDTLRAHGAGHVLNSWTRMPPIGWQHGRILRGGYPGQVTLIRALLRPGAVIAEHGDEVQLKPGSRYDEAVEAYQPYDHIHLRLGDVRADILRVIREVPDDHTVYTVVNNRLEGHAPQTIAELEGALWGFPSGDGRDTAPA